MAWYTFGLRKAPPSTTVRHLRLVPQTVTAAATQPKGVSAQFIRHTEKWQDEVWGYYDALGEFNFGVHWQANMLSRVRLRAAKLQPDVDEPEIQTQGPAAELMMLLGGGVGGQAQLMKRLTVQLAVPGEGYLIGETSGGTEHWMIRSVDEVQVRSGGYWVMDEESVHTGQDWRPLANDHHVVRIWRPHDRYYHLADSPARSARDIMRELELVNRKIASEYLSRLASAGLVKWPDEINFPTREEFADAPSPLIAEWIEVAAEAIQKPGTASAVIPIPVTGPAEALKELEFVDFTMKIDEKIIERRDSAIKRLATKLDMPAEVLLGMGDVNHWSAWQLEEGALKTHIAPLAELICDALTRGYLQPRLEASGEDPAEWVVWYDMSELALRPDRSQNASEAYDRLELSGVAYRRELGFDEDDKPDETELEEMGLKLILRKVPDLADTALRRLTGQDTSSEPMVPPAKTPPAPGQGTLPPGQEAPPGPPEQPTGGPPPPQSTPPAQQAARLERERQQSRTQHILRFGPEKSWELRHPDICTEYAYSCPYTQAVMTAAPRVRPGMSGTYLCHLDAFGLLVIDGQSPYTDVYGMIKTSLIPAVNGHG